MNEHLQSVEDEFAPLHKEVEDLDVTYKKRYIQTLFIYLGYMILPFILSIFVVLMFRNNPFAFKPVSAAENAIEYAVSDVNAVLVIRTDDFLNADPSYFPFFYNVFTLGDYSIYTHTSASFYMTDDVFELTDDSNNPVILTALGFNEIFNEEKTTWSNGAQISYYIPDVDEPNFTLNNPKLESVVRIEEGILPTTAFNALYSFIIYIIVTVPLIWICKPIIKTDYIQLKSSMTSSDVLSKTGIGVLYLFATNIFVNVIVIILQSLFGIPSEISANQLSINRMLSSEFAILMIITAVILAPIVEEFVFRKAIFGLIKNTKTALIISSLIFGAIHITTELLEGDILLALTSGLSYIGGGFILGLIYIQNKKNIHINILVHMVYNLIGILLAFM